MKFFLITFFVAVLVALAMAAADQQPIIVSFPEGTPYSELEELKAAIAKVVSWPQPAAPSRHLDR
jgi:hypothetical protein